MRLGIIASTQSAHRACQMLKRFGHSVTLLEAMKPDISPAESMRLDDLDPDRLLAPFPIGRLSISKIQELARLDALVVYENVSFQDAEKNKPILELLDVIGASAEKLAVLCWHSVDETTEHALKAELAIRGVDALVTRVSSHEIRRDTIAIDAAEPRSLLLLNMMFGSYLRHDDATKTITVDVSAKPHVQHHEQSSSSTSSVSSFSENRIRLQKSGAIGHIHTLERRLVAAPSAAHQLPHFEGSLDRKSRQSNDQLSQRLVDKRRVVNEPSHSNSNAADPTFGGSDWL